MGRKARARPGSRGVPTKEPRIPNLSKFHRLPPTNTRKKGRFRKANEQVGLEHIVPQLELGTEVVWDSRTEFGKLVGMVVAHRVSFPATPSMTDIQCKVALEASPFGSFDEVWVSEKSLYLTEKEGD